MTAALWNGELAVVFMKLKKGWHVEKKMKKTRPRLFGLKQHNRKQTNTFTFD